MPKPSFAESLKKGVRVIANVGTGKEPAYYAGKIKSASPSKGTVTILFDDGDVAVYKAIKSKLGILGIGVDKVRKSEIPAAQLAKWLIDGAPVAKTPVKPKPKAPPKPVAPKGVKTVTPTVKGELPVGVQKFLVDWVAGFNMGNHVKNSKLYDQMLKVIPIIPKEAKTVKTTYIYRGIRMHVPRLLGVLDGGPFSPRADFVSFSTKEEVADRFASDSSYDKDKGMIGMTIYTKAKNVVINVAAVRGLVNDANIDRVKLADFNHMASSEAEVIVQNKPVFTFDKANVISVHIQSRLFEYSFPPEVFKDVKKVAKRNKGMAGYSMPLNKVTTPLLKNLRPNSFEFFKNNYS